MQRLIVLDTETTGLSFADGDRIVEIGCVELVQMRVGDSRQWYVNPQREIPQESIRIHGITNDMVADKPTFPQIAEEFLAFIGDDPLVIHNADFDMGFLNGELGLAGLDRLAADRAIDTMPLARRRFPGSSVNLDALCKRFGVDNSDRQLHGALLDSNLLAQVYVELTGGNQFRLDWASTEPAAESTATAAPGEAAAAEKSDALSRHPARKWTVPQVEAAAHVAFLERIHAESGDCIWLRELEGGGTRKERDAEGG